MFVWEGCVFHLCNTGLYTHTHTHVWTAQHSITPTTARGGQLGQLDSSSSRCCNTPSPFVRRPKSPRPPLLLTESTTPASAGLRASEASRLLNRWAPVVSSGRATYV